MGKPVIIIIGPTCSGKTKLGIELAEQSCGEIISADSRQLYKKLNIGTATPNEYELYKIKHHFINILHPDQNYDVSIYEKDVLAQIIKIFNKGKQPIIVGGSGLYIKAIVDGIFEAADADESYRNNLMQIRKEKGNDFLFNMLKESDPESASKMLSSNWKRVIRALEVLHVTGKPIWQVQLEHKRIINFEFIQFGLKWNRDELYENINKRVDQMLADGLVDEVKNILNYGYSIELNSLNTVGYKEIISYLNGQISLERAVELIKRNTRRYAKRQMTWFRKDSRINWLEFTDSTNFTTVAKNILKKVKKIY